MFDFKNYGSGKSAIAMILEKGTIDFGKSRIDFAVQRSSNRRTVSVFVDPQEGVFLRSPLGISIAALSRIVYAKGSWILDKQRRFDEIGTLAVRKEFVSGETFIYLGRRYRLRVDTARCRSVLLQQGRLNVSIKTEDKENRRSIIRNMLKRWYCRHALPVLLRETQTFARKLRINSPRVELGNQLKRWGSCNGKDTIHLNWQIIMAPMSLVDYVVAHELCHLVHNDHSQKYWSLLGRIMPDYEIRRERLRKEGPQYYF